LDVEEAHFAAARANNDLECLHRGKAFGLAGFASTDRTDRAAIDERRGITALECLRGGTF
jgi:hypothetical protein